MSLAFLLKQQMKNRLSNIFAYIICLALGASMFWLYSWWQAGIPTGGRFVKTPMRVNITKIAPKDEWVKDFELEAVQLNEIQSKREYLLLIIRRKNNTSSRIDYPDRQSRFILRGLNEPGRELVFGVNPKQMQEVQHDTYTLLLDFGGNLFLRSRISLSNNLELLSNDY